MDHQLAIIELAKSKGLNPARLSPSQYRILAVQVRSKKEVIDDLADATNSLVSTTLGNNRVPDEAFNANMAMCESNKCGKYRLLDIKRKVKDKADGAISLKVIATEPACDACNCQGKLLKSKCRDNRQKCPIDNPETNKPYWDNRGIKEVK